MSWRHDMTSWRHFVTCKTISGANQHINLIPNSFPGFYYLGRSLGHLTTCCRQPMTSWHDVMTSSWRHRDIAITGANGYININPNVNQGSHHTGKSLENLSHMLRKCHDVMSWRHDVIVTCKTISGTNQPINLITNSFPGFYYMGRSWGHFTTWFRQLMTSWHDVMTSSWRHRDMPCYYRCYYTYRILIQMWIRDSTTRVSHLSTWHTC